MKPIQPIPVDYQIRACKRIIVSRLSVDYPKIDFTSRMLGISVRTLQRRLHENGLNYSQLVDQARLEVACRLLKAPNLRLGDIAEKVGYANPSALSRAFKRWLSISPREYRQRGKTGKPG